MCTFQRIIKRQSMKVEECEYLHSSGKSVTYK